MEEYRFYVNRGEQGVRSIIPEVAQRFPIIEISRREGRILQECVPLSYIPSTIFQIPTTQRGMYFIARKLYNEGRFDVTITDLERNKLLEMIFGGRR